MLGCRSNHHHLLHNEAHKKIPTATSPNPNFREALQGDSQANGSLSLSRPDTEGEPQLRTFVTSLSETKEYLSEDHYS